MTSGKHKAGGLTWVRPPGRLSATEVRRAAEMQAPLPPPIPVPADWEDYLGELTLRLQLASTGFDAVRVVLKIIEIRELAARVPPDVPIWLGLAAQWLRRTLREIGPADLPRVQAELAVVLTTILDCRRLAPEPSR